MLKKKKYFYIVILLIAIFTICSFIFFNKRNQQIELSNPQIISQNLSPTLPQIELKTEVPIIPESPVKTIVPDTFTKSVKVSLDVLNKTYTTTVNKGSTIYDVMQSIQNIKENNFSFIATNYLSLGYFVEEINGVKGIPGKYWIYYVNNKEASVGVSKYIIKSGDIISWKQEGI